jgi:hypothetical protein
MNQQPDVSDAIPITTENWSLSRIRGNPKNARRHPAKQIEQLRASLREFGQPFPLLVREDGELIAGHGRLQAMLAEGWSEADVVVARGWTPQQCRRFALLDNKVTQNSEWDDGILAVELSELQALCVDVSELGFSQQDMARLIPPAPKPLPSITNIFQVLIECEAETEQVRIMELLEREGIPCRALIA